MNKKGFMLTETLIVSTVVLTSLVLIYTQFAKINNSYGDSFRYDNVSDIYALGEFANYLEDEDNDSLKDDLTDYIDISDCTSSYYKSQTYCEEIMKATNIKTLIFTNIDSLPLYGALSTSNTYSVNLQKYVKSLKTNDKYRYRLIAEFNDGTFSSIPFGLRYTPERCFTYEVYWKNNVEITDYLCGSTGVNIGTGAGVYSDFRSNNDGEYNDVVIPPTLGGYNVARIGKGAFEGRFIDSVVIPEGVLIIGDDAFSYNDLKEISLPNTLLSIGPSAFAGTHLEEITIPDSVTEIEQEAFLFSSLSKVTLGSSLEYIGNYAFAINKLTSVTIPDSVTTISSYAFSSNDLTSIIIPDSVTAISSYAFSSNALTSVTIPDSVTTISSYAFSSNHLTSIIIPDSITAISSYAFSSNALTSVTIPDSVTTIEENAFAWNELTSVTIPNSVTEIYTNAFRKNEFLTSITIDNVEGAISGSPWGATNATITYLRKQ